MTRQTALLTARIDLDGPACRYKTSTARIAAAQMPAVIMRALNCPEGNSFALREPGRIFKAFAVLMETSRRTGLFMLNSPVPTGAILSFLVGVAFIPSVFPAGFSRRRRANHERNK